MGLANNTQLYLQIIKNSSISPFCFAGVSTVTSNNSVSARGTYQLNGISDYVTIEILSSQTGSDSQNWLVNVDSTFTNLQLQVYYYPNWEILVDGVKSKIDYSNEFGLMTISVPAGQHRIVAKLQNTQIRTISNVLSFFAIISFIIYLCLKRFY